MAVPHQEPSAFQNLSDRVIDGALLWAIPRAVRPNHVTAIRFLLLPLLVWLLVQERRGPALAVFVIAVSTDFIDGAMARRRDQITNVGIVLDPVADKLVVGSTLALLGWEYLVIKVIVIALAVELVGVFLGTAFWMRRPGGGLPGANAFGKVKMVLQSVGGALFLAGAFLEKPALVDLSLVLLWAALLFAALSVALFVYRDRSGYYRAA